VRGVGIASLKNVTRQSFAAINAAQLQTVKNAANNQSDLTALPLMSLCCTSNYAIVRQQQQRLFGVFGGNLACNPHGLRSMWRVQLQTPIAVQFVCRLTSWTA